MKRLLKLTGIGLLALATALTVFMVIVYAVSSARMRQKFEVKDTPVPLYTAAADVAEGKRLFLSRGCADCHGENLAGKTFIDDPAIGRITGANLTKGKGGVIAERTDFDLERAIRHGVGKGGRALIVMPSIDYEGMTNQDVGRLIAYIRKQPAVDRENPPIKAGPLGRFLYLIGKIPVFISAEKIDHAKPAVGELTPAENTVYGRYVAATCTGCHRHDFTGGPIQGAPPEWPPAANITPQALGNWTEKNFISALRTGKRPDGSDVNPIMPWRNLSNMTDTEIKALWKYLRTL